MSQQGECGFCVKLPASGVLRFGTVSRCPACKGPLVEIDGVVHRRVQSAGRRWYPRWPTLALIVTGLALVVGVVFAVRRLPPPPSATQASLPAPRNDALKTPLPALPPSPPVEKPQRHEPAKTEAEKSPEVSIPPTTVAQVTRDRPKPEKIDERRYSARKRSTPPPADPLIAELLQVPEVALAKPVPFDAALTVSAQQLEGKLDEEGEALPAKAAAQRRRVVEATNRLVARIHELNQKSADHFLETLVKERRDLAGLPFLMGETARISKERQDDFCDQVDRLHVLVPILNEPDKTRFDMFGDSPQADASRKEQERVKLFWEAYEKVPRVGEPDSVVSIRMTALAQMLAVDSIPARAGLVKFLARTKHLEATQALAKLAVFSTAKEIRSLAVAALKERPKGDCTEILLQSLRFPWPAAAQHASEAIIKLQRVDLVPQLVDLLAQPDARAPVLSEGSQQRWFTVRELVRVNHARNCLLCHALHDGEAVIAGLVPLPIEPLPRRGDYHSSSSNLFVRADVTYLREDFSVLLPVEKADPWPKMQRFDFLVRTRVLTESEAPAHARAIDPGPDYFSPYHRAVHAALRELTGRDAEPTAKAWRAALGGP